MVSVNERLQHDVKDLKAFLGAATPSQWIDCARNHLDILLIDHAHCEKKAAATAVQLMFRYPRKIELLRKMSRLAREELVHFDQVCMLMQERGIQYDHLPASRYASSLHQQIRTHEPVKLMDTLIVGALVEARSCERFDCLIPVLDEELAKFYSSLFKSEARHYRDYLHLAELEARLAGVDEATFSQRVTELTVRENQLINGNDETFRFHSGVPVRDLREGHCVVTVEKS